MPPLPLADEEASEAPAGRKRARQKRDLHADGEELFLPVHVRRQRKRDPAHWAHEHRPPTEPPKQVQPLPSPPGEEHEDLWAARDAELRAKSRENRARQEGKLPALPVTDAMVEVPLAEVELDERDMLSPEESQAKSDIWHEVNKGLLVYWAAAAERKKKQQEDRELKKRERQEKLKRQEARLEEEQRRRAARYQRRRPARAAEGQPGQAAEAGGEEPDDGIADFWQARSQEPLFATQEQEPEDPAEKAWEARVALETALREEREERELLRRSRRFADEINDLFSM